MMEKKGLHSMLFRILIALVLTVAVMHTSLYFALYGTGIPGFGQKGISGFSIGKISGEAVKSNPSISVISRIIIAAEWLLLIAVLFINSLAQRLHLKKEAIEIKDIKLKHEKSKTDIDALYDLLKEKKRLPIPVIAKLFGVKEELVEEWAKILEDNNLASVYYPRMGEPELRLN